MPLIVDVYNVLHTVGVLPPDRAGIDLSGLVRLIRVSRWANDDIVLVCDGKRREEHPRGSGRLEIRYSGPGRTADDLIRDLVQAAPDPRRVTVVSSDRAIIRDVRRLRSRPIGSDSFLHQLVGDVEVEEHRQTVAKPPPPPPPSLAPRQVEQWVKIFGLGGDELERAAAEIVESETRPAAVPPEPGAAPEVDATDSGEPGPVLPPEIIEEAERLLDDADP